MKLREVFQQRGIEGVLDEIESRLEPAKEPEKKVDPSFAPIVPVPVEEEVKLG
jgi:hypothetical protein